MNITKAPVVAIASRAQASGVAAALASAVNANSRLTPIELSHAPASDREYIEVIDGRMRLAAVIGMNGYAMIPAPGGKDIRVEMDENGFYRA